MYRQRQLTTDTEAIPFSAIPSAGRPRAYLACPLPLASSRRDAGLIGVVLEEAGYEVFDPVTRFGRLPSRELFDEAREAMRGAACLVAELSRPSHWVGMALAWAELEGVPTLALAPDDLNISDLTLAALRRAGAVLVRYPEGVRPDQATRAGLPSLSGNGRIDVLA